MDGVEDVAVEVRVMPHGRVPAALAGIPVRPKLVVEGLALAALHPVFGKAERAFMLAECKRKRVTFRDYLRTKSTQNTQTKKSASECPQFKRDTKTASTYLQK